MATSTLSDYFGTTLSGLITSNASAIASDLSVTQATITNPDGLFAAIVIKAKAFLEEVDVADQLVNDGNGISIAGFGTNGAPSKVTGSGNRANQLGYQYQVTCWIPDTTTSEVDPKLVL